MENRQPINPFNNPLPPTVDPANKPAGTSEAAQNASISNSSDASNPTASNSSEETNGQSNYIAPTRRSWLVFGFVCFLLMLVYIYNSGHANKGLRTKEKLSKELKELHSESISLESQITNASTQSALSKRLEGTGLKEITSPPTKLARKKKEE